MRLCLQPNLTILSHTNTSFPSAKTGETFRLNPSPATLAIYLSLRSLVATSLFLYLLLSPRSSRSPCQNRSPPGCVKGTLARKETTASAKSLSGSGSLSVSNPLRLVHKFHARSRDKGSPCPRALRGSGFQFTIFDWPLATSHHPHRLDFRVPARASWSLFTLNDSPIFIGFRYPSRNTQRHSSHYLLSALFWLNRNKQLSD